MTKDSPSDDDHDIDTNFAINEEGLPTSTTTTDGDATLTAQEHELDQQPTQHVAVGSAVDAAATAHDGSIFYNEAGSVDAIVNAATSNSLPITENIVVTGEDTEQNATVTTTVDVSEDQKQPSSPLPSPPPREPLYEEQSTANLTEIVESVVAKIEEEEHSVEIDGTMIAEAAAAAVAAVGDVQLAVDAALAADRHDEGAAAAAVAAVAAAQANEISNTTIAAVDNQLEIDADMKKNEQRRKRYREKSVEEDYLQPGKKQKKKWETRDEELASRRLKDRERYAGMTPEQRELYNAKRRDQYHRQSETSRQRRRERERDRYHSLESDDAKNRNTRRAKLERQRYQKLTADQLEAKNRKRRERAATARAKKAQDRNSEENTNSGTPTAIVAPPDATTNVDHPTDTIAAAADDDDPPVDTDTAAATGGNNFSTVIEEAKVGVNLEYKIDQPESNATENPVAANDVEKAAIDVAVGTVKDQNVYV